MIARTEKASVSNVFCSYHYDETEPSKPAFIIGHNPETAMRIGRPRWRLRKDDRRQLNRPVFSKASIFSRE